MIRIASTILFLLAMVRGVTADEPTKTNTSPPTSSKDAKSDDADTKAVQAMLKPWQTFQKKWVSDATVILTGKYRMGSYPCLIGPDGIHYRYIRSYFNIEKVIKGNVKREDVDFNNADLKSNDVPPFFIPYRQYLVFLKPDTENMIRLNDPKAFFTLFGNLKREEVVAIVDLSRSRKEAEAFAVEATQSGTFGEFQFTPKKWAALRFSMVPNIKDQQAFIPFIRNVVMTKNADLKRVRSYLGKPDRQSMQRSGHLELNYELNPRAFQRRKEGEIYCSLEVHFSEKLELVQYSIKYVTYYEEGNASGTRYLTPAELKEHGLTPVSEYHTAQAKGKTDKQKSADKK